MENISWDEYYMLQAKAAILKSKDPSTQVGCVLVDEDNIEISKGFNGMIRKSKENRMWEPRNIKLLCVIHAEMNALLHSKRSLKGATAYITHGPCENCLKHLAQAGVKRFVYEDASIMRNRGTNDQKEAIQIIMEDANIEVISITGINYIDDLKL